MSLTDFLCETDATNYAGVTLNTLARFAEAGYLHIKSDSNGKALYSKQELFDVFGISELRSSVIVTKEETASPAANQPKEFSEKISLASKTNLQTEPSANALPSSEETQVGSDHRHEIQRLKLENVISIQERMLDAREAELRELREERNWLRTRLERLEEKSERDQMLLLSEGQTIRRLLSIQENKKSPIRLALEWLGLSENNSNSHSKQNPLNQNLNNNTIEI